MKKRLLKPIIMGVTYTFIGMVFQLLFINMLWATETHAQRVKSIQDVVVQIEIHDKTLMETFSYLERKSPFTFVYDKKDAFLTRKFNLEKQTLSIEEILVAIARENKLRFKQINNNITVSKPDEYTDDVIEVVEINIEVSGKVTDENGDPLPGASVTVAGTATGTVTDMDGNYSITVPDGATLIFSYIGFETMRVSVDNRTQINVTLKTDMASLEEVVVIGYGSQRKADLTGSISSVGKNAIETLPANTFEQALQGRVPGVQVIQGNAAPGGGLSIRIRGTNSVTGNTEPLYVIDGVPIISSNNSATVGGVGGEGRTGNHQNALASLNPNDIESIEILKDASAAAIYGSRGSNGVVIVTTKRGMAGKPRVQYDAYMGVQEPVRSIGLISPRDYGTSLFESYDNPGLPYEFDPERVNQLLAQGGFDYQEYLFRRPSESIMQNHQLSVSGASEQGLNYYVSLNYFSQDGIIKNTGFDRYSARVNLDKSFEKFRFGTNFTISRTESDLLPTDGITGIVSSAIRRMEPILPLYDENGNFSFQTSTGSDISTNPAALIHGTNDRLQSDRLLGSFFGDYEIMPGLTFRTTFGIDIDSRSRNVYFDRRTGPEFGGTANAGLAQMAYAQSTQLVTTNTLSYNKDIGDKHRINFTGVYEAQTFERRNMSMINRGFPSDALGVDAISSGQQPGGPNINNGRFRWQIASWVARAFYSYDDRYLFTLTGRADGSSRFGADHRWGFFPSGALAWRVSQENFMANANAVDELKFRVSYGVTGNQEIGVLQTAERLNPTGGAVFGGIIVPSVVVASFANETLKWEESAQFDIGINSSFFGDRLSLTADYYIRNTTDLLLAVNLPISAGFSGNPIYNLGAIQNRGVEIELGYQPIRTNLFSWNLNINFTRNRNEVKRLYSDRVFGPTIDQGRRLQGNLVEEGLPVGQFWGYKTDGVFASAEEALSHPVDQSGVYLQEAGEFRIVDINGDGIITPDDRTVIGDPNPDFFYGLNSVMTFKNWTLDLTFQGVHGIDILWTDSPDRLQERFDNRWRPDNPNAAYPKFNVNAPGLSSFYDDRMIWDGSFFRLRNIVLAYQLPVERMNLLGISALKVYGSVANAFTITNYPGYNPDINSFGQSAINQGLDIGGYPLARIYTLGLNLTF